MILSPTIRQSKVRTVAGEATKRFVQDGVGLWREHDDLLHAVKRDGIMAEILRQGLSETGNGERNIESLE